MTWRAAAPGHVDHGRCGWCDGEVGAEDEWLAGRVRCHRCGVSTTWPVPDDDQLDDAYGDWYRPAGGRFGPVGDAVLRRSRGALARRIARIAPAGPVLDVGSGDGTLLGALRAQGRRVVGLERAGGGEDVVDLDIEHVEGSFAAIVFWHSLEHLRAPVAALRRAADLLQPGGVLVVAVPNAGSLQAAAFDDRWFALDLPRHLVHIPGPTLLDAIRRAGLTVDRVSHVRGGQSAFGWVHGFVGRLLPGTDLYDAIRAPTARRRALSIPRRLAALVLTVVLVGSSRVDLQACKLEYSIVSPK